MQNVANKKMRNERCERRKRGFILFNESVNGRRGCSKYKIMVGLEWYVGERKTI